MKTTFSLALLASLTSFNAIAQKKSDLKGFQNCLEALNGQLSELTLSLSAEISDIEREFDMVSERVTNRTSLRNFFSNVRAGASLDEKNRFEPSEVSSAQGKYIAYLQRDTDLTNVKSTVILSRASFQHLLADTYNIETSMIYGDRDLLSQEEVSTLISNYDKSLELLNSTYPVLWSYEYQPEIIDCRHRLE